MSDQKSHHGQTGPRTPEGKARSSQNALKHGLTAAHLSIPESEREEFEDFRDTLKAEINPAGALQMNAFNHLLHASWNIQRIQRLEGSLFAEHPNPFADETAAKQLDRLARYLSLHQRAYDRTLKKLEQLQTNVFTRGALPPPANTLTPPLVSVKAAIDAKRNAQKCWPDGFDPVLGDLEATFQADMAQAEADFAAAEAANSR